MVEEAPQLNPDQQPVATPAFAVMIAAQPGKQIEFVDAGGLERRPHPGAAECYASPEIIEAVGEHFLFLDEGIEVIEGRIVEIEGRSPEDDPKPFNPLNKVLLQTVLETAAQQLPELTISTTGIHTKEVRSRFGHKQLVQEEVTTTRPVTGYVTDAQSQTVHRAFRDRLFSVQNGSSKNMEQDQQLVQELVLNVLTDTTSTWEEKNHALGQNKLPLLAVRLRDAGIGQAAVSELSWDDVTGLIPELKPVLGNIDAAIAFQQTLGRRREIDGLSSALFDLSPAGCKTIARLYYSGEQLAKLTQIHDRLQRLSAAQQKQQFPDEEVYIPPDFMSKQTDAISRFFENEYPADSILIHGTPYAPRIIKAGALKSTHSMNRDEFSFFTGRTHDRGIDGSRGVHWAGRGSLNYAHDMSQEGLESQLRVLLRETHNGSSHAADEELAKGGVGMARLAIQLGDLVGITPYGGDRHTSHSDMRNKEQTAKERYGVVELTDKGWQQIQAARERAASRPRQDAAYVAAPEHHPLDEIYNFIYPLDKLLLGIPSLDPDTIPDALRKHGWSEEQIQQRTFHFSETAATGVTTDLDEAVARNKPYHQSMVVPIRMDI